MKTLTNWESIKILSGITGMAATAGFAYSQGLTAGAIVFAALSGMAMLLVALLPND